MAPKPQQRGGKTYRVETGIYRNLCGYFLRVSVNGTPHTQYGFPLDTSIVALRLALTDLRAKAEKADDKQRAKADPIAHAATAGTFAADVPVFLNTLKGARKRDVTKFMTRWIAVFGARPRNEITPVQIQTQIATWMNGGIKRGSLYHWRAALGQFYRTLNGNGGINPVQDVKSLRTRYTDPRGIDYAVLKRIIDEVPTYRFFKKDGTPGPLVVAKVIFTLQATTGMNPAMLNAIEPNDLKLAQKTLFVRPRKKGAGEGGPGALRELSDEAAEAFRTFVQLDLFGKVRARSAARSWALALVNAKAKWAKEFPGEPFPVPMNCRPYDVRHSYGSQVYRVTGDIAAVAELLGHAQGSPVTMRYIQARVSDRSRAAVRAVGTLLAPTQPNA